MLYYFNTIQFLFLTILASLGLKSILLWVLIPQAFRSRSTQTICWFLVTVLISSMMGELSWCIKLTRLLFFPFLPYEFVVFSVRFAWAFLIIKYQALGLFLASLTSQKLHIKKVHWSLLFFSSMATVYYLYSAFFNTQLTTEAHRATALSATSLGGYLEITMMRSTILLILPMLIVHSFFLSIQAIRSKQLPKILHKQLTIIVYYLLLAYVLLELFIGLNFEFKNLRLYTNAIVGLSALLITYIIYYCVKRVINLRFLNFIDHVEVSHTINFVNDFKGVLEQLSFANSEAELIQLTTHFFTQTFTILESTVRLKICMHNTQQTTAYKNPMITDDFFAYGDNSRLSYLLTNKILIYDELVFSNFYDQTPLRSELISFLDMYNADIFLPILDNGVIIAHIIISRNARPAELFSSNERDQMIVYAAYLSNIINLLQNRNLESLILQENELREELYKKNQEINHYKESIRSFLKNMKQKEIGIIFYKNRRFIYANHSAKEMLPININLQLGHPITRALKNIVAQVQEFKATRTLTLNDSCGNKLILSAVSSLEQNTIIITVCYPDIADVIATQRTLLKDPSKWDYLLYLETTKPGQLINNLIPSSSQTLLNFKIALLQTALTKKATLLEVAEDDLVPMVELLHHLSMRQRLQSIKLDSKSSVMEVAAKIFGINPIFGIESPRPFLENLNEQGTLFIENIEYLDLQLQIHLAEFIKYGYFRRYKSDQKIFSDVRIICSSASNLEQCIAEKTFLPELFEELKKTHIRLPSLSTLSATELNDLAQGFSAQALETHELKEFLELTDKEKDRLFESKPLSLQALKSKVQKLLVQKSKKNNIEQDVQFDSAFTISDPELIQASKLGKQALRDPKTMVLLWNKFKNQNKIAAFLGVNRSSVNRRCREYNLEV